MNEKELQKVLDLLQTAKECFEQENDGHAVVHDYADDWLRDYKELKLPSVE